MYVKTLLTIVAIMAVTTSLAGADEINPVLGKVGDFTIRETDLDRLISFQSPQAQKQFQEKPELKTTLVRDLLLKKAVAMKARSEGYDKKPEYREKLSYLIEDFLSGEYIARRVVTDSKVSEAELKKYYQEHEKEYLLPETVKARHIFIQLSSKATAEERVVARKKAEAILDRLKKGGDFAKVAEEVSEDADSAKKGGALGQLSPGKTNSEEFEKAAFALKRGEISEIVQSPFGFHIIKADEKTDRRVATFEETKTNIELILKKEQEQRVVKDFLEKTYKESGLEVSADKASGKPEELGNTSVK